VRKYATVIAATLVALSACGTVRATSAPDARTLVRTASGTPVVAPSPTVEPIDLLTVHDRADRSGLLATLHSLPPCEYEDGNSDGRACSWDETFYITCDQQIVYIDAAMDRKYGGPTDTGYPDTCA
jgi:hypothetical protein